MWPWVTSFLHREELLATLLPPLQVSFCALRSLLNVACHVFDGLPWFRLPPSGKQPVHSSAVALLFSTELEGNGLILFICFSLLTLMSYAGWYNSYGSYARVCNLNSYIVIRCTSHVWLCSRVTMSSVATCLTSVLIYIRGAIKKFLADPSSVHNIIKIVFASYSSPLELHLTTSELWFGQEQEGILPELLSSSFIV